VRRYFQGNQLKFLYLLALFQLVAGPLVLLQFTVFCKLTVPEIPRQGLVVAVEKSWQSGEFQTVLKLPEATVDADTKSPLPGSDPPAKALMKAKMPCIAWAGDFSALAVPASELVPCADWARVWTPAWPQAPPGPPPRVG
jgi:hypothetical protein